MYISIQKNKYMLERYEWAAIYKVSTSTIIKAEKEKIAEK